MNHLYWLSQIQPEHRSVLGQKIIDLGHLLQVGLPVVPGFVISPQAFRQFLATLDWLEPLFADLSISSFHPQLQAAQQLRDLAQLLRKEFLIATVPPCLLAELTQATTTLNCPTVILRPSITVSELFLDRIQDFRNSSLLTLQVCPADPDVMADRLKQIWAELFSAKSLFYWQRLGIDLPDIHLSVLVQPIESAQLSGWVDADLPHWLINATPGLGMALAWGEVQPDRYGVAPDTGQLQFHHPGQQFVAYQIRSDGKPVPHSTMHPGTGLQAEWLSIDTLPHKLDDRQLAEIYHLTHRVIAAIQQVAQIEWTLTSQGQLYLTQVLRQENPPTPVQPPTPVAAPPNFLVQGIPAASGQAIARALILQSTDPLPDVLEPVILVAPTIPLDWLPRLKHFAAIVMEQGSLTSHCAIVARELGIPAVVGASHALQKIPAHAWIWVDGDRGLVHQADASTTIAPFSPTKLLRHKPAISTQLLVNLSQMQTVADHAQLPVHGVGLIRSELLLGSLGLSQSLLQRAAWGDRLTNALIEFAQRFQPRPVYYRSLDWHSAEWPIHPSHQPPAVGQRGTFYYLQEPALFEAELVALAQVQQAGYDNLRLILPFVRTVEEFIACRQQVAAAGLMDSPNFQLWIMAEVPSVLFLLPDYVAAGVQGIAIGTNDLTQLLFGVDRDSPDFTEYNERQPAVQRAIAHLIQQARSLGIPCSLCGQAPVIYPDLIEKLVRWGITAISVEADAVELTYWAIVQAEQQLHLESSHPQDILADPPTN